MPGAQAEATIESSADRVWARIGNFGDVSWVPNAQSCEVDGDVRTVRMGEDRVVKQRLLRHDDAARSYSYALASEVVLDSGRVLHVDATISVAPDGDTASTVVWSFETDDPAVADTHGAYFQGILDQLKDELEHTA